MTKKFEKYSHIAGILEEQAQIREKLAQAMNVANSNKHLIVDMENEVSVKKVSLQLAESKLETGKLQQSAIENNILFREKIEENEIALRGNQAEYTKNESICLTLQQREAILELSITNARKSLARLDEIEESRIVYATYCEAMHRTGIPVDVLRLYIPKVNYELNRMLSNVVPFGVSLVIGDDSTKIDIIMNSIDEQSITRPASMASGMEKLLINFAIRYALIAISNLNRPNIWMIDEGFGVLSQENLDMVKLFFDNARDIFETIVIITHIDELKDIANWVFDIEKKDGISKVLSPQKNI